VRALALVAEAPISSPTDRESRSSICAWRRSRMRRRVAWSAVGTVASTSVAAAVSDSTKANSASLPMGTSSNRVGRPISRGLLPPTSLAASEASESTPDQSVTPASFSSISKAPISGSRPGPQAPITSREILASRSSAITPATARGNPGIVATEWYCLSLPSAFIRCTRRRRGRPRRSG
jgi:hypothetical protein